MYPRLFSVFSIILILTVDNSISQQCSKAGTSCDATCENILLCTSQDATPIPISPCGPQYGGYCKENEDGATCSTPTAECTGPTQNLICGGYGSFPDPTKCGRSIVCTGVNVEPVKDCTCRDGWVVNYNDVALPCIQDDPTTPVYPCPVQCTAPPSVIQMGTHYCYACTENGIFAYLCATSKNNMNMTWQNPQADGDKNCIDRTPSSSTSSSSTSTSTSSPPTSATSAPPKCNNPGDIFSDPDDCHKYYWCDDKLVAVHQTCSTNRYFYKQLLTCVDGTC